jgi:hypothetical protein
VKSGGCARLLLFAFCFSVGAGLPAMAAYQPTSILDVLASSRASPPTGLMSSKKMVFDANTVGAGLPAMAAYEPTILYAQSYIPRP